MPSEDFMIDYFTKRAHKGMDSIEKAKQKEQTASVKKFIEAKESDVQCCMDVIEKLESLKENRELVSHWVQKYRDLRAEIGRPMP